MSIFSINAYFAEQFKRIIEILLNEFLNILFTLSFLIHELVTWKSQYFKLTCANKKYFDIFNTQIVTKLCLAPCTVI